jgi:hypothetical protein
MRSIELLMAIGVGQVSLKQHQRNRGDSTLSHMESGSDAASDARYSRPSQQENMHISSLDPDFDPDGVSSTRKAPTYKFGLRHIIESREDLPSGEKREVSAVTNTSGIVKPGPSPAMIS